MARAYYERLSPTSAELLEHESSRAFAHAAELLVFEPGPLARPERGVDFEAIRRGVEAALSRVPRARQKLRWIPFENHPIWVDDPDFNLDYHLRHTSLPRPGSEEQLRRMVARIHAQRLDRSRPLWECWVLEGLEGGRFALLWKTHLVAVDEAAVDDLSGLLLHSDPSPPDRSPTSFRPRPVPSAFELVRDEVVRQARLPRRTLARAEAWLRQPEWRHDLERRARRVARMLGYSVRPRADTPLSGPAGPHRRFARLVVPLAAARRAHRALDAPVHDILLAVLCGAVRRFFGERLVNPATVDFRVSTPVSLDRDSADEAVGEWIVDLPIWESDSAEQVARIRAQTAALHSETPALDARTLAGSPDWAGSRRLSLGVRAVSRHLPVDLVLVNLPGPQVPLHFRGARLLEGFGLVPLREDQALAVAVTSYDGKLCWGLNADFDRLPDLDRFAAALAEAFEETTRVTAARPRLGIVDRSA